MRPIASTMVVVLALPALLASCHRDLTSGRAFECLADFECGDGWRCARCATGGYGPAGVCVKAGEALSTGCSNDLDIVQGDVAGHDVRDATDLPAVHDTTGDDGGTADKPVGSDAPHTDVASEATDPGTVKDDGVLLDAGHDEGISTDVAPKDEGTTPSCQPCRTIYDCLGACPSGNAACQQACTGGLCAADQQEFQAFVTCLDTNGCYNITTDPEFSQCLDQHCSDPYMKCFSGTTYATCVDLYACLSSCPDDNPSTADVNEAQVCGQDCYKNSSYEAQSAYQAKYTCLYAQCPTCKTATSGSPEETQCNTCASPVISTGGACATEWQACTAHGAKNCADTWECLKTAMDQAGAQACYAAATFTAQGLIGVWEDCSFAKCTTLTFECLDATKTADCKAQWDACGGDTAGS